MSMTDAHAKRGPARVPPPLVYVAGFAIGLLLELMATPPELPAWAQIAGGVAGAVVFLTLDTPAMRGFQRHGTPVNPYRPAAALVTDGPYRLTRNPMYLGMACAYAGAAVAAEALWALALLALVLLFVDRSIIPGEERHMAARFG